MKENQVIEIAIKHLTENDIPFVLPGMLKIIDEVCTQVTFYRPEFFEPNTVIDPPDVIIKVNLKSGNVSLVEQM